MTSKTTATDRRDRFTWGEGDVVFIPRERTEWDDDKAGYAAEFYREAEELTDAERRELAEQAERDHAAAYGATGDEDLPIPASDIPEDEIQF